MRKHFSFLALLLIMVIEGYAQTRSVQFSYDNAGNRIGRAIVLASMSQTRAVEANDTTMTEPYTDIFADYQLHVYPNPTHGELKIELQGFPVWDSYHLLIASTSGKVIVNRNTTENPTIANLTDCPAGIYIMRIQYKNYTKDFKIIRL